MKLVPYSTAALKVLRGMPRNESRRIMDKVAQYAADPATLANNVTALKGRGGIRLRVGDWRVIMDERWEVLDVLAIGPRGGIYD